MRLLCTGDLHLGRRSSRVPPSLASASAADAWRRLVVVAIEQDVDAVLLSGDVVDQENRYFEALGPLERGLLALRDAHIPVLAVAGNHDWDVLPRLARTLPEGTLRLLGANGEWERHTLVARSGARLHVDGWSFTAPHAPESPLPRYAPPPPDGVPVLGMVHGDLDAPASDYAPLPRELLRLHPVTAWLLGHVHAGGLRHREGEPPILYPGSPQPLDPGEPGRHGAWLLQVPTTGPATATPVPVATVQYDMLDVDLSACTDLADARAEVVRCVHLALHDMLLGNPHLVHAALRLRLTGRTALHGTFDALVTELRTLDDVGDPGARAPALIGRACSLGITHVTTHTRAAYDLSGLAERRDAAGTLARLLQRLEAGDPSVVEDALWRAVRAVPAEAARAGAFAGTALGDGMTDAQLLQRLTRQAERLLDALLLQQGAPA